MSFMKNQYPGENITVDQHYTQNEKLRCFIQTRFLPTPSQINLFINHTSILFLFLVNRLSPNIHVQILQTDLNTFP